MAASKQEIAIKLLVVGDVNVGKTSLIQRYVYKAFSDVYVTTLGVDFAVKKVRLKQTNIKVQLWDIAGQERFIGVSHAYYKDAAAAVVVFDIKNGDSLESARKWKKDLDENVFLQNGDNIPTVLFANKSDLIEEDQARSRAKTNNFENMQIFAGFDQFCENNHFCAWFLTSAKTGQNVKEGMDFLIHRCVQISKQTDISCDTNRRDSLRGEDIVRALTMESDPRTRKKARKKGCCELL